jgi:FkbM family methyltransferase
MRLSRILRLFRKPRKAPPKQRSIPQKPDPRIAKQAETIAQLRLRLERQAKFRYANGLIDGIASMLKPGDVVCDCGANVGKITAALAASGATVHAFEPDPHALEILRAKFEGVGNVILHPVAVGDALGSVTFYRTTQHDDSPTQSGQGSSLFAGHAATGKHNTVETSVEMIDFPAFLADLLAQGASVPFVKLDVEGAELKILRKMLDQGLFDRIHLTVAETHELQVPSLADQFAVLRADVSARYPKTRVNLDWI